MKNIVAMIPARAGSEGLRNKNIKPLNGLPLLVHSLKPALACSRISAVYVNSDNDEYLDIGTQYGAISYKRPESLGQSDTTMKAVVQDFVRGLRDGGEDIDAVIVLYPTYPFRSPEMLDDMIRFFCENAGGHSLIGLKQPDTHPYHCVEKTQEGGVKSAIQYDADKYYRRQDYPEYYQMTALAMVIGADHVDELNAMMFCDKTVGYVLPHTVRTVDIDTITEFHYAEFLIEKGYV
ncbi:N-acylneuraminate cytidylyltransferase [Roseibium hamelinense]|uniref:N-acylneuraminate cytidylyltransferase n=1 Tax=Roseibium hamelinense TaxID=150831 RepID=A0A562T7M6_9HYPH|nr:acylneuraminate cytidylyltransferase family protein [Roseibium hamelinense]MTI43557.1 acylneuraminate cytidylyltransferase family protein [Roseibium hamelinense]TWI89649.1 N-acylneuraminate cytidylyltransferase [Roseibium hamelinense]